MRDGENEVEADSEAVVVCLFVCLLVGCFLFNCLLLFVIYCLLGVFLYS